MNKKAELFKNYLAEKDINCFELNEVPDDELETAVFRSQIEVAGQKLPTMVILDDSIYTMIRVRIASAALRADNEVDLVKAINELNSQYKIFKYYFAADGALILDAYLIDAPATLDSDKIYTVLDVIVQHLQAEYKNIMKIIWG